MKKVLFFISLCAYLVTGLQAVLQDERCNVTRELQDRSSCMTGHVFVVSEWMPKENCEQELLQKFKQLMKLTLANETGCIRAHATKQIIHPGSPGKSKYTIVLLQEYNDIKAFEVHCSADYVTQAFKECILDKETSLVEDWRCRLFREDEEVSLID